MVGQRKISVPPCWAWCQITVGTSPASLYSSTAVRTCSGYTNCMLLEHKPIIVIGADETGARLGSLSDRNQSAAATGRYPGARAGANETPENHRVDALTGTAATGRRLLRGHRRSRALSGERRRQLHQR